MDTTRVAMHIYYAYELVVSYSCTVIIMKIGLTLRLRACPARGKLAWDKKYYLLVDLKIKHVLLVIVLLYTNAVIFESTTRRQSQ